MIAASLALLWLTHDAVVTRTEGAMLLGLMLAYTIFVVLQSRRAAATASTELDAAPPRSQWDRHWSVQMALIAAGLALLVQGADWLVHDSKDAMKAAQAAIPTIEKQIEDERGKTEFIKVNEDLRRLLVKLQRG